MNKLDQYADRLQFIEGQRAQKFNEFLMLWYEPNNFANRRKLRDLVFEIENFNDEFSGLTREWYDNNNRKEIDSVK